MRPLSAAELLRVWERGHAEPPVRQALLLLTAAAPDAAADEAAGLPIGRRDALLLALRESTFGPWLNAVTKCPDCGTALDLSFTAADIRADAAEPETVRRVTAGDCEVEV